MVHAHVCAGVRMCRGRESISCVLLCYCSPFSQDGVSCLTRAVQTELAAGKPQQLSCLHLPHGAVATGTPATAPGFLWGIQVQVLPFAQEEPMSHLSSPKARNALRLENLLSQKLASILTFYFSSCELESFCYISLFIMCVLVSVCPCVCTCFLHTCHSTCVEITGQLLGIYFLHLL